ncbi:MAG: epoxyqueuosine reductase QueH [Clostridiales bacterium]|nr:epoxyqueuosine reductase QueH [Clostridiales bacterium]MCF8022113.1 epoxyqueuosine reductase QueH [Clostridiales bacterium]
MRLLLHICCAPCAIYPVDVLRNEGTEVYGYFYNPNIHPYTEWKKRRDTLEQYANDIDLKVIFDEGYYLEEFLRKVVYRESVRCQYCYYMRLGQAAAVAKRGKFDAFSSTLLVSPFQDQQLIKEVGETAGKEKGVPFLYRDFRPGFKEATTRSKELGLYRQQYCGCIYSERDRYCNTRKKRR